MLVDTNTLNTLMRRKTNKLRKLESQRYSIITDDLERCICCQNKAEDINEIFMGRNRLNSIRYGLCIPLCRKCHTKYHNDREMQLYWMKIGLDEFLKRHSFEEFVEDFKYIKGLDLF